MSHFVVLVNVPAGSLNEKDVEAHGGGNSGGVESILDGILGRYDENRKTEEHEEKCSCVGREAEREALEKMKEKFGSSLDGFRKEFHRNFVAANGEEPPMGDKEAYVAYEEKIDAAWKEAIQPRVEYQERCRMEHPRSNKTDPGCEQCKGTGVYNTTCNPESKWDFWSIGGRWTGFYSNYDPSIDPDNLEKCSICNGTGDRPGWVKYSPKKRKRSFKDKWAKECNGCNGCQGTGKQLKFSYKPFSGDIIPVIAAREIFKKDKSKYCPFAFVDAEGKWHGKGEMGWFGITFDEKKEKTWEDEVEKLFDKAPDDSYIVVIDCHI